MNPIGLTLPLQIGRNGYFEQSYDTLTQVKANITNLLRTKKGERRMNPNFGSGLQEYLFEQNLQDSPDIIKQIIMITNSLLFTLIPLHNNANCEKFYQLIMYI